MDKPGYTKGPWHVVPYGDGNSLVICTEPDGNWRICFLATPGDSSGAWETIKADARLIAAAPDLIEALRDLSIFYGDDTEAREVLRSDFTGPEPLLMDDDALRESVWNNARAALSKATGGSHEQG